MQTIKRGVLFIVLGMGILGTTAANTLNREPYRNVVFRELSVHVGVSSYQSERVELLEVYFRNQLYMLRYGERHSYGDAHITFNLRPWGPSTIKRDVVVRANLLEKYQTALKAIGCRGPFVIQQRSFTKRVTGHRLAYEFSASGNCNKAEVLDNNRSIYVSYERTDLDAPQFGMSEDAP